MLLKKMTNITPSILLTTNEKNLFRLLNDVSKESKVPVVCRVAGGWVRDKLLGLTTHDLDIALDSLMGIQYANSLSRFLKSSKHASNSSFETLEHSTQDSTRFISHISKIKANPSKSKHLETATCQLLGFSIDFVNLRSESYNENSRIPEEIKFGTPLEDALRRDCTINSLFYNISTEQVEDFTGHGLNDLKNKIIRTPLPPKQTLCDDPLRVLRAIRFASRFNFSLEENLKNCIKDHEILNALSTKISKERILEEVTKMLSGPSPNHSLSLLCQLNVLNEICVASFPEHKQLELPTSFSKMHLDFSMVPQVVALFDWLRSIPNPSFPRFPSLLSSFPKLFTYFSMFAFPFLKSAFPLSSYQISTHLKLCFKFSNKETEFIAAVSERLPLLQLYLAQCRSKTTSTTMLTLDPSTSASTTTTNTTTSSSSSSLSMTSLTPSFFPTHPRVQLGTLVRWLGAAPLYEHYPILICLSLIYELLETNESCFTFETLENGKVELNPNVKWTPELTHLLELYHQLLKDIDTSELNDAWNMKPLLNGNVICEKLNIPKGPKVKHYLNAVIEWQLAHPSSSNNTEECLQWLPTCLGTAFDPICVPHARTSKQKRPST